MGFKDTISSIIKVVWRADTRSLKKGTKEAKAAIGKVGKEAKKATKGFTAMGKAIGAVFSVVAIKRIGRLAFELAKLGARAEQLNTSFGLMAKKYGFDAHKKLGEMTKAAGGLITKTELLAMANRSLALGIPADRMGDLITLSRKASRALGQDFGYTLESLSVGIARQSKLWLDNLGIIVNVDSAYERYARTLHKTKEQLTDTEKRTAFLTEAFRKGEQAFSNIDLAAESAAEKIQQLETAWTSLKEKAGTIVLPIVVSVADVLTGLDKLRALEKEWADYVRGYVPEGPPTKDTRWAEHGKVLNQLLAMRGKIPEKLKRPGYAMEPTLPGVPTITPHAPSMFGPGGEKGKMKSALEDANMWVDVWEKAGHGMDDYWDRAVSGANYFQNTMMQIIQNTDQGFQRLFQRITMGFATGILGKLIAIGILGFLVPGGYGALWTHMGGGWGLMPFQHGGIVTGPTLGLLGESGSEAVVPLEGPNAPGMMGGIHLHFEHGVLSDEVRAGRKIAQWVEKATSEKHTTSL